MARKKQQSAPPPPPAAADDVYTRQMVFDYDSEQQTAIMRYEAPGRALVVISTPPKSAAGAVDRTEQH